MRMNLRGLFILISCLISYMTQAQELNALVKVQAPNLTTSDKSVVQKLENGVKEFLKGLNVIFKLQLGKTKEGMFFHVIFLYKHPGLYFNQLMKPNYLFLLKKMCPSLLIPLNL